MQTTLHGKHEELEEIVRAKEEVHSLHEAVVQHNETLTHKFEASEKVRYAYSLVYNTLDFLFRLQTRDRHADRVKELEEKVKGLETEITRTVSQISSVESPPFTYLNAHFGSKGRHWPTIGGNGSASQCRPAH